MPYNSLADLPPTVRKMPVGKQRQWMAVFNKAKASGKSEKECFQMAYGAVKMSETGQARRRMLGAVAPSNIRPDGLIEIQVLEECDFEHPIFGRIRKTKQDFQKFIDNFKKLGQKDRIPLDYDHGSANPNPSSKDQILAAGWVQDVIIKDTENGPGLFVLAEPTPAAKSHVQNKELRYSSLEWEDLEDGDNIIKAVALTNRPWIKTMAPIMALSEVAQTLLTEITSVEMETDTNDNKPDEVKPMKGLLKALGLAEDATEEQALAKLAEMSTATTKLQEDVKTLSEKVPGKDTKVISLSEYTKLEADAAAGATANKRLNDMERDRFFDKAISVDKKILPAQRKALSEMWDSGPAGQASVKALVEATPAGAAGVKLNEVGSSESGDPTDPLVQLKARAADLRTKNPKLSQSQAEEKVLNSDPELHKAYRSRISIREK